MERVFEHAKETDAFVDLLREVLERDELTVFAWSLLPDHFHLAVRTGAVSLDRPLRSLQQRVTRGVNFRCRVYGPLWQGRYKAKLVQDQRYFDQLLIYIHLNPVGWNRQRSGRILLEWASRDSDEGQEVDHRQQRSTQAIWKHSAGGTVGIRPQAQRID